MITLGLITCERPEFTQRTVESFRRHNPDVSRFRLLHVDDASSDERNMGIAKAHGFKTVSRSRERQGILATRKAFLAAVDTKWLVMLANDWESARPFPWPLFDFVAGHGGIWALRLYGRFKERDNQRPTGTRHKARKGRLVRGQVRWHKLAGAPEPTEVARIHVGSSPVVVRTGTLRQIYRGAATDPEASVASGAVAEDTARVVENVMFHFGDERTPGFMD